MNIHPQNNNLNYLIDPTFPNVNKSFVLSFKTKIISDDRDSFSDYYVSNVGIKDFCVLNDGKSFLDLPVRNEQKA